MYTSDIYTVTLPDGTKEQVGIIEATLVGELMIASYNVEIATERVVEAERKVRESNKAYDMYVVHSRKAALQASKASYQHALSRLWRHCQGKACLMPLVQKLDK